jgi:alpha-mannosidase
MGGDNLPPEINASRNARAWNEKYIWPRVVVATNREFLSRMESHYGRQCETHRGDIPSWWADGPASTAKETGTNRLLHDRLSAAETLWTAAWIADPRTKYPRDEIRVAYDKMIHFDEHTWGASTAIREPQSENTKTQWQFKADYVHDAEKRTNDLYRLAMKHLTRGVTSPTGRCVAVWTTLTWPRSDVVELALADTPLAGVSAVIVTDTRTGRRVPSQRSEDGTRLFFIARDVPPVGYAVYALEAGPAAASAPAKTEAHNRTLENAFYRITARPESGGLASWYDKRCGRELLDTRTGYLANQPIYETPRDGRSAVDNMTQRTVFDRVVPKTGRIIARRTGPVFQELVTETSLPTCPHIVQTVRLYEDLKIVDIQNVFTKQECYEPEALYIAFPFDVARPRFHVEIADAVMRPGKDQLAYSCLDYYSIQHWLDMTGDGYGITLAPLDAPLVLCSGLHAGKWSDRLDFDNGNVFSWVMNNYWFTNFRAAQGGEIPFRYRLTSHEGDYDAVAATRFAWQPFYPLEPVWLEAGHGPSPQPTRSLLAVEGDPALVTCIKLAETADAVIVRLIELRGNPARCVLRWTLPAGRTIRSAHTANVLEQPGDALPVAGSAVTITLRPYAIATVGIELEFSNASR